MKLQLLESASIPSYANIHLKDGRLVLRVSSIEMSLVLNRTQYGYQWSHLWFSQWFVKPIIYHSAKDRQFTEFCEFRLN